ncbi:hypothetical protein [Mycobacterium bourgelatii]|uniref:Uncharacterized protein n=1 Tax=Mycobacterium bourgelatii TaxID=1273442 RepID=A0A7I9YQC5_MYCBU|nr:hypothetical protein [Mycobacterium bourgelatii]MCV6973947.1 hypothetical protein [Mycobacterium bourgelatii]GFG90880.1 hypothetical protein MBOU_29220 [Mycobacterium bourgelatii]
MADEELDALYVVPPEAFTAERTRLAKAAKSRGDADAAKRISAARKPTTVAWTANLLALRHPDAVQRLAALGDRLQQAHTEMDGAKIRELSAKQRALIEELSKDAFKLASESGNVKTPSATLRDDLTGTLQAAIADAEVRGRLGRLTKAEQWSGFGGFGEAAPAPSRKESRKEKPKPSASARDDSKRADSKDDKARQKAQEQEKLQAAVAEAEQVKTKADAKVSELQSERDAARQRRDDAAATLREAERALDSAEARYEKAMKASDAAKESVSAAKARLNRLH